MAKKSLFENLISSIIKPGDTHDIYLKKQIFLPMCITGFFVGCSLTALQYFSGAKTSAIFPLILACSFLLNLLLLFTLKNLEILYLQAPELRFLPKEFFLLTKLKTLYITAPKLTKVAQEIILLPSLLNLSLTGCQINELCLSIGKVTKIESLQLNKNKLESLPKNLEHIESLKVLNLADNQLKVFNLNLANLTSLMSLNLDRNGIEEIPTEVIKKMKSLNTISLDGNKFPEDEKAKITRELGYWFGEI